MKHVIVLVCWSLVQIGMSVTADAQTKLTIATDNWPPYEIVANDVVTGGFSTEVLQAVLKYMQVDIIGDIRAYPFARLNSYILKGAIDAAYSLSSNEIRRQSCYFPTESLVKSQWVLFIRKKNEATLTFTSLDDLKGKTIGVVRAYAYTSGFWEFLETEQNFEVVTNDTQNFMMLSAGRVDFIIAEYGNASTIVHKLGLRDQIIPLLDHPIYTTELYVIFNKQTVQQQFVEDFSSTLKVFKTTLAYENIYQKYFPR